MSVQRFGRIITPPTPGHYLRSINIYTPHNFHIMFLFKQIKISYQTRERARCTTSLHFICKLQRKLNSQILTTNHVKHTLYYAPPRRCRHNILQPRLLLLLIAMPSITNVSPFPPGCCCSRNSLVGLCGGIGLSLDTGVPTFEINQRNNAHNKIPR